MTYEDDIKRVLVRDGDGMMSLHTGSRYCDVPIETELIRTERVEITYEEALEYVKHNLGESDAIKSKVKELIVEAMEKQIPKKPSHFRYKPKHGFPKCPCCNTFGIVSDKVETCGSLGKSVIYGGIKNAYCTNCGQAIDWANMEEVQI